MFQYAVAYKPYGVLSSHYRGRGPLDRGTLTAMGISTTLFPAGRLDLDSEGLLVLTDDGQTLHRLTHPQYGHAKTYFVLVLGRPDAEALRSLRQGVEIKLGRTRPAEVEILAGVPHLPDSPVPLPPPSATTWLRMVLHEGMNRQIKRMTAAVGHPTVRLARVAIGHVTLPPDLMPGTWREMTTVERKVLLDDAWPRGRRDVAQHHRRS